MVDTVLVSSPGSATLYSLPKPTFSRQTLNVRAHYPKSFILTCQIVLNTNRGQILAIFFYGTTRLLWKTLTLLITLSDQSFLFPAYPGVYLLFHFTSVSEQLFLLKVSAKNPTNAQNGRRYSSNVFFQSFLRFLVKQLQQRGQFRKTRIRHLTQCFSCLRAITYEINYSFNYQQYQLLLSTKENYCYYCYYY